jgi:hypothetical protein
VIDLIEILYRYGKILTPEVQAKIVIPNLFRALPHLSKKMLKQVQHDIAYVGLLQGTKVIYKKKANA